MTNDVEKLDKAFEWLVLLLTLSFATFFQWIITLWQPKLEEDPKYISNIVFTIRFVFVPIIVIAMSWFGKVVVKGYNKKMLMRKFAWMWAMSQLWWSILLTGVVGTMDLSEGIRYVSMLIVFLMLPIVYLVYRKVMNLYKNAMSGSAFWRSKLWDYGASFIAFVSILFFMYIVANLPPTIP